MIGGHREGGTVPCKGDRNSWLIDPMKSAFWRSAAIDASRETSAMTLLPNAMKKLSSVSRVKICRLDVVQTKPLANQREDLKDHCVSNHDGI